MQSNLIRALLAGVAIAGLAAGFAGQASAQTAQPSSAQQPAQSNDEARSAPVVLVTARRRVERLVDVPVAVTVADPAKIQKYDSTDLSSLSEQLPDVQISRAGAASGAALAIRGISNNAGDTGIEQAVIVDLDGVPSSRGLLIYSDLFDTASVQVLEGPQALFFGKNSPAGVVNVTSNTPGKTFGGYIQIGFNFAVDRPEVYGALDIPLTDDLTSRLAFHVSQDFSGFSKNVSQAIADPFPACVPVFYKCPVGASAGFFRRGPSVTPGAAEDDLRYTLAYRPNANFDATLRLLATQSTDTGSATDGPSSVYSCPTGQKFLSTYGVPDPFMPCSRGVRNDTDKLPVAVAAGYPYSHGGVPFEVVNNYLGSLTMDYKWDKVTFTSITGYYHSKHAYWDGFDGTIWAQLDGALREYNDSFTQEFRAVSQFDFPVNFTAGAFYEYDSRSYLNDTELVPVGENFLTAAQAATLGFPEGPVPVFGRWDTWVGLDREKQNAESAFAELDWKILPNLELAGGARYTTESKSIDNVATYVAPLTYFDFFNPSDGPIKGTIVDTNVSPQVTLTWHPIPNTTLYAAYKTGFLSGGFSTPTITPAGATFQNQQFQPETVSGEEVGAKAALGRFSGDATVFDYQFINMQLESYNPQLDSFFIENAGVAKTIGFEVKASYQVTPDFDVHGYLSYTDTYFVRYTNGNCYTGQTAALGCNGGIITHGVGQFQDFSGQPLAGNSPWQASIGADYQRPISGDLMFGASGDVIWRSSFLLDQDIKYLYQPGFAVVNAMVKVFSPKGGWEADLIAQNLFNQFYFLGIGDKPGGSNVAPGELTGGTGLPQQIIIQFKKSF
jgi:iron complex outermembrane receptor protein